jgi:hypothetical protein
MKRADLKRGDIVGVKTSKHGRPHRAVVVDAGAWGERRGAFGGRAYGRSHEPERENEKITVEYDGESHEITVESYLYRTNSSQSIITMRINGDRGWVSLTPLRMIEDTWENVEAEQARMNEDARQSRERADAKEAAATALAHDLMERLGIEIVPHGYNGGFDGAYVKVTLDDLKAIADRLAPTV